MWGGSCKPQCIPQCIGVCIGILDPRVFLQTRIPFQGSPKLYHCYRDESLNSILRDIAAFCHRLTFSVRVFRLVDLQGRLARSDFVSRGTWLSIVAGRSLL